MKAFFRRLRELLHDDRVSQQKIKLEEAVRAHARALSDAEFHRVMTNYHSERAGAIKPDKDWWGYARHKEGEKQHMAHFQKYSAEAADALAEAEAEEARYQAAKGVQS